MKTIRNIFDKISSYKNLYSAYLKACRGEWCGGFVPYGYEKVERLIEINDEKAAVVRRIFSKPELLEKVWQMVNQRLKVERLEKEKELSKVNEDLQRTKNAIERYFNAFESGELEKDMIGGRITKPNLRIQQLEEEKDKLENEIVELAFEGIDLESIKMFIDALDKVMENGGNEAVLDASRLMPDIYFAMLKRRVLL